MTLVDRSGIVDFNSSPVEEVSVAALTTERMLTPGVTVAMVMIEFTEVVVSTTSKAAMTRGMSQFVYTVYSNALAIFILLPSTFFLYRKRTFPKLRWSIICRIFLLAILSTCVQLFMNFGVSYSSPTLLAAMVDITPAFTFLLAIISRMEKLDFRLRSTRAKSTGTILSIAGALVVTLYKGQPITSVPSQNSSVNDFLLFLPSNWIIGGIFCAAAAFCLSILYIVQTWIINDYPEKLMVTLIACIIVTMQSAIVSLIAERDPKAWTLKPDMELLAIVFSAVLSVSLRSLVHTWACHKKGPVYTSMFKPLGMIIAILMGVSFLGDTLYLGSVIGAIIIAFGFYSVLWGKSKEEVVDDKGDSVLHSPDPKVPLLQNKNIDV